MGIVPLFILSTILAAFAIFILWNRPTSSINQWFSGFVISIAGWTLAISTAYTGISPVLSVKATFACASMIAATFVGFLHYYPTRASLRSFLTVKIALSSGIALALLSIVTPLVVYDAAVTNDRLQRETGPLYPVFAVYFISAFTVGASILITKWRRARGFDRVQLQYLGIGLVIPFTVGVTTNLILPLLTGRSTYSWVGPYFSLLMVVSVTHAIVRHRLMDLRLVFHQGLTITLATLASLVPVVIFVVLLWSHISGKLTAGEISLFLFAVAATTILILPARDVTGKLLDRYVYRAHANYRKVIRDASRFLTRFLHLRILVSFIGQTITESTPCEGVAVYLPTHSGLEKAFSERPQFSTDFESPQVVPDVILETVRKNKELLVTDEIGSHRNGQQSNLHAELARLNWALVLPLLSEDAVIGIIVIGPKLSGDPFYSQDLDLLMTLANQAGIAIKNAQLYTQVVLANEYIENIVATIDSGVVAIDSTGRVTMFNRRAEQLTGLGAEQIRSGSVDALPLALATLLKATVADGEERTEPEIALPDGTVTRPVMCAATPLRDPSGTILGAVGVFSDLTPVKELESERRRTERLAYFEILASSLAHEIKNPLVAIKTFSQLIPRRHQDTRFVDEFSRIVTREIGRMERLLDRLQTLSRPSDRPRQRLDVRTPITDAVEFLKPAFDEKRIAVALNLGAQPRFVRGDQGELEQLFINLLLNGHEATPPDGKVSIELAATDDHVTVTLADTGPGIPPELFDHLFDAFFTTKSRGSGLGLTISSAIVDAHHAKLRAANHPDGGASFTVEFPVAAAIEHEHDPAHHV